MSTRILPVNSRAPRLSDTMRSSAMAVAGTSVIGGICALVTLRALADEDAYASSGAAAIGVLGAAAVLVSVLRWVPSLREESMRPVPRRHAAVLLGVCVVLWGLALEMSGWRDALVGVLTTVCLLNAYLACWGYRSLFLLRRIVLFSVVSWPAVASAVFGVIDETLAGPSDLVYRRLGSLGIASAADHPWRVFSAMTDHATVAVTGVIVLTVAASRLRLSVAAVARLLVGSVVTLIIHHTLLLTAPIETYGPSVWARVAAGPMIELGIAMVVAISLFSSAAALTSDEHAATPSPDRDPEIFGAHNVTRPRRAMRLCNVVFPALLLTAAVMQS